MQGFLDLFEELATRSGGIVAPLVSSESAAPSLPPGRPRQSFHGFLFTSSIPVRLPAVGAYCIAAARAAEAAVV